MKLRLFIALITALSCPFGFAMKRSHKEIEQAEQSQEISLPQKSNQASYLNLLPMDLKKELAKFQTNDFAHPAISFWLMKEQALHNPNLSMKHIAHNANLIAISPTNNLILTKDDTNNNLLVLNIDSGQTLVQAPIPPAVRASGNFNYQGTYIGITFESYGVPITQFWNIATKTLALELENIDTFDFAIQTDIVATLSNNTLQCFDLRTGQQIYQNMTISDFEETSRRIKINSVGTLAFIYSKVFGEYRIIDMPRSQILKDYKLSSAAYLIANPKEDEALLLFNYHADTDTFKQAQIIDIHTGNIVRTLRLTKSIRKPRFNNTGNRIFALKQHPEYSTVFFDNQSENQIDSISKYDVIQVNNSGTFAFIGNGNKYAIMYLETHMIPLAFKHPLPRKLALSADGEKIIIEDQFHILQKLDLINPVIKKQLLDNLTHDQAQLLIDAYNALRQKQHLNLFTPTERIKAFDSLPEQIRATLLRSFIEIDRPLFYIAEEEG